MSWEDPVVVGSLPVGAAVYAIPGGAVLYVSTTGNNANPGTLASPKASLAGAISAANSGTTIILREGVYTEEVVTPSNKTLTIQAYPDEEVWFDGSVVYSSWSGSGPWTSPTVDWPAISASNYPQVGDGLAHLPEQVWIDDVAQTQIADNGSPAAGQFSVNRSTNVITIGTNPSGKIVRVAEKRVWMTATGPVHLKGFGVRRYSPSSVEGSTSSMLYVAGSAQGSTLENVIFRESGMHAMSLIRPVTFSKFTIEECNNSGIQVTTSTGTTLREFSIQNINRGGWHPQPIVSAIKVTKSDQFTAIHGIVDHLGGGIGVWMDTSVTRVIVANISVNDVGVGMENEGGDGGFYSGVQHYSWWVNNRVTNAEDWALKILDSGWNKIANNDFTGARVSINMQQDGRYNHGLAGESTFEITPWVSIHNTLINNKITSTPAISNIIAYSDPPDAMPDPDGGPDFVLLGWDFFDLVSGNWTLGSDIELGKVDGFRNSYNWTTAATSPAAVGGPPGARLGTNHQGASAPSDTIATPLPDEIADLLGIPHGYQKVGTILPAPIPQGTQEEPNMSDRLWFAEGTDGAAVTTGNFLANDGTAASVAAGGTGGTLLYEADNKHAGATGVKHTPGTGTSNLRLPFAATTGTGAVKFYLTAATLPPAVRDVFNLRHASGQLIRLAITSSGALESRSGTGAIHSTSAGGAFVANRRNRIELTFTINTAAGANDSYTAKIFDGDSTTADATLSGTVDMGTANASSVDLLFPNNSSANWEIFLDTIGLRDGSATEIGPAPNAVAAFTGSGTLSAVAVQGGGAVSRSAALSGSGTLSATAVPRFSATAAFTGSGTLSATLAVREIRAAAFSGSGTLFASTVALDTRTAEFSGSGTLTAMAVASYPEIATASFTGEGALSAVVSFTLLPQIIFIPPVEKSYMSDTHPLFRRVPYYVGITVLKEDGIYRQVRGSYAPEEIDAAEKAYIGGHEYVITQEESDELTGAGYGIYITVV